MRAAQFSRSPSEYLTPAGAFLSLVSSTDTYATPGALIGGPRADQYARRRGDPRPVRALRGVDRRTQGHHARVSTRSRTSPMSRTSSTPAMLGPRFEQHAAARSADASSSPPRPIISITRRYSMSCSRYWDRELEGRPQALLAHRLIDVAIVASALPRCSASASPRVFASRILRLRRTAGMHSGAGADRRRSQQRQSCVSRRRRRDARRLAACCDRSRSMACARAARRGRGGLGEADRSPAHRRDARRRHRLSAVAPTIELELD